LNDRWVSIITDVQGDTGSGETSEHSRSSIPYLVTVGCGRWNQDLHANDFNERLCPVSKELKVSKERGVCNLTTQNEVLVC
jgi:hypothetical protein